MKTDQDTQAEIEDFVSLKAADVRFVRDSSHGLVMQHEERNVAVGSMLPAFPISAPKQMIVIRSTDGEEIGVLDGVAGLDRVSRRWVNRELDLSYFLPAIQDIMDISESHGVVTWFVDSNRGERTFEVRNMRQNIRKLGGLRLLVRDVDGNRYEIRDVTRLPSPAQALLDVYS